MGLVEPLPRNRFGLTARVSNFMVRRHTGAPIDLASVAIAARIPAFLRASAGMERFFIGRRAVPGLLLELVAVRAAAEIGCTNCLDVGSYMLASKHGMTEEQLRTISDHDGPRGQELFSEAERAAMDLAVAMTATPPVVEAELEARLCEHFDERQRLELVAMIAWENQRSRLNVSLGLSAQGYTEYGACAMASPAAGAEAAVAAR
jgi:AhpD family alkylhydroperoxidase